VITQTTEQSTVEDRLCELWSMVSNYRYARKFVGDPVSHLDAALSIIEDLQKRLGHRNAECEYCLVIR
jgi:hypothetical protein